MIFKFFGQSMQGFRSVSFYECSFCRHNISDSFLALFEERALLLGRAGRHEDALGIYIYMLGDTNMAEQ